MDKPFVDGARRVNCPHCNYPITEFEPFLGLIPAEEDEENDDFWNHTKLVCSLRQEISRLKGK